MLTIALSLLLQAGVTPDSAPLPPIPRHPQGARHHERPYGIGSAMEMITAQEIWTPYTPHVRFAPALSRFNRIEGLSLAVAGGFETGPYATAAALVRIGTADLVPNAQVELSRERGFTRRAIAAYYRLAASNEWGNPLALGASLGALFIGRDDGFYYRAAGIEISVLDSTRTTFEARLFGERHRSARVKNNFTFADVFGNRDFRPNIIADDADIGGATLTWSARRGVLAEEKRLFTEAKFEIAAGDFDYTRGMVEGTAAQPLFNFFIVSLTASAGMSGGTLPVQRNWFLGGSRSLRGQRAGVMAGDAFWMTQAEIGTINVFARPVLFFDAGWAGDRDFFDSPGRIGTGAGIGGSFFDGSLRFDLARGLFPGKAWRGALYLEARL